VKILVCLLCEKFVGSDTLNYILCALNNKLVGNLIGPSNKHLARLSFQLDPNINRRNEINTAAILFGTSF